MDYGHTNPQDSSKPSPENQAFFTAGVGDAPASENAIDNIEDLNTSSDPWAYTPERDNASIGNKAIFSNPDDRSSNGPNFNTGASIVEQVELGKIMPTAQSAPIVGAPTTNNTSPIYNQTAIRTEGDHLGKDAVGEIKKLEDKLSQDGELTSFYEEARKLTSVNLKNSYNREIGGGI